MRPSPSPPARRFPRRPVRPVRAAAVAAVAGVLVVGAAAAATLTTVFAPTRVAPVTIHKGDLQAIAGLLGADDRGPLGAAAAPTGTRRTPFGVLRWSSAGDPRDVASLAAAQAATGLTLSLPRTLPSGVGATPRFGVQGTVTATITLGPAAGRALAGRTLSLTAGPAAIAQYRSSRGFPTCRRSRSWRWGGPRSPRPGRRRPSWSAPSSRSRVFRRSWPRRSGCSATSAGRSRCPRRRGRSPRRSRSAGRGAC